MTGHGTKFGRKKEQAIAALLTERKLETAAKTAGISASTLKRWMKLPEFKAAYFQARGEVLSQTSAYIQQNSGSMASLLFTLALDRASPASVRASICQYLLDRADKSFEREKQDYADERLTALERVVGIDAPGKRKSPKAA